MQVARMRAVKKEDVDRYKESGIPGQSETFYDPSCFEWIIPGATSKVESHPVASLAKTRIRINRRAAELLGFQYGEIDTIRIGINPTGKSIAICRGGIGFRAFIDKNREKLCSVYATTKNVNARLIELGWPIPCRIDLKYDQRNNMLVGMRPDND